MGSRVSLRSMAFFVLIAAQPLAHAEMTQEPKLQRTSSDVMKVAFVISDNTTLIDVAGPMQVFDQVVTDKGGFQTFAVSETRTPIKAGTLTVVPDYTFDDAPDADIVVVGAQAGGDDTYLGYLRKMRDKGKLMLSVCTGAAKFARAGLLDGLDATTHHDFIDSFSQRFRKVHFIPNRPYVHSAPRIYTAGGEMSGIELALHIVELYYDHETAVKTARYMEYRGPAWQK